MPDDPLLPKLMTLLVLVLVNAFFAAAEIAVLSLSEARLKKQAGEGDKLAARLLVLTQDPDHFLSAIQIAVTLAGLLSSAFAADSFSGPLVDWLVNDLGFTVMSPSSLNGVMVVFITVVLSYFSLVLGELVPKRIAMKKTEAVAKFTVGAVSAVAVIFRPVIWLLSKSTDAVLRLLRVDPQAETEDVSEEEILMMVELGEERGAIEASEKEMIGNIFRFSNITAGDMMIHRTDMVTLRAEADSENVLHAILTSGHSRFPVYREDADHIVGILNARDFLLNVREECPKSLAGLLRPAYFVPESVRTDVLFRDMQSKKVHMAIVVDEYGGTSGLVTVEDLLEKIVGDIYDEFDPQEEKDLEQVEPGVWKVSGSCGLERVAKVLELEFPGGEEPNTLGGLVFAQLSAIPEDGAQLEVDACGLHIRVLRFADRRVEWALVSKSEKSVL